MTVYVCLFASVSPGSIFTKKTKFLKHVNYARDSVLLWPRCDTLCTSGLWMTSYLYIMGHMQACQWNSQPASLKVQPSVSL